MELTILGNSGPFPGPGGACSGYLLKSREDQILLDAGNGVLGNLLRHTKIEDLTMVVLSHYHADHISDLFVMRYALEAAMKLGKRKTPLIVYAPKEPEEEFARIPYRDVYDVRGYLDGDRVRQGNLSFFFARTSHAMYTCAVAVIGEGKKFVYTGDTGVSADVTALAKGADLLLAEANLLEKDKGKVDGHLTGKDAALMAKEAGVKRLLLTHLFPDYEAEEVLNEAKAEFPVVGLAVLNEDYSI